MLWTLSTLGAFHRSVQRCTVRAFLPLLLVLLSVLSGAACRDEYPFTGCSYDLM